MSITLDRRHLRSYRDLARLLVKYGRSDLVTTSGLDAALAGIQDGDEVDLRDAAPSGPPPPEAAQLADDLEAMGPTYVKLGQLLSTRSDLVSPLWAQALARLQDRCEPVPIDQIERVLDEELSIKVSTAFAEFDRRPLASASLGQVHRAVLRSGRAVAVKVQRPGVRERVAEDLSVLGDVARSLDRHTDVGRRFGLTEMLAEFQTTVLAELDYRREADNLRTLGANLAGFDRIVVPQPVDDFCTGRVLTMELVRGRKITKLSPLVRMDIGGEELADQVFRAYLEQILVHGFFHADPHPGNVFLTDDRRIALLDLGMVARVSPSLQDLLVKLLLAVGEGNGEEAADVAVGLGERREEFDDRAFRRRVADVVIGQQGLTAGAMEAGSIVMELTRISGECGLRPAPELTMIGKALLNLDQVGKVLDPTFDPNAALRRHASEILRARMLRAASPGNVFSAMLEVKEFVEQFPGRVNKLLDAASSGDLRVRVDAIDQVELMRGFQKVANRIALGVVIAALIIGAALIMRIPTSVTLFGYPALAIVLFLVAAGAGLSLVVSTVLGDRRNRPRH